MKRLWLCAALLAFATTAHAADPLVGIYRLNVAQSKSADAQPMPLAATLTFSENGDNLALTVSLQRSNGSRLETASIPGGGRPSGVESGMPSYDTVTVTRANPTTIDLFRLKDGKEALRSRYSLSADGRPHPRHEGDEPSGSTDG